jgi:transposase
VWLYDFDAQMRQQALADLRRAYINFFERRGKFPKFKKSERNRGGMPHAELLSWVAYKALWNSQHFVQVDRFFPSTKRRPARASRQLAIQRCLMKVPSFSSR